MRAILAALLMLAATCAWAEVVKVTETADTVFYVDAATITRNGNLRRAWTIQDYAKQEPNGTRSRRSLLEIDCTGERIRSLSVSEHSEPMAGGEILNARDEESLWSFIGQRTGSNVPPRTANMAILRFVCSR